MISSQSALLLVILASSLILTCHSQIKLTPCLSLVIFISETSVATFVISFLFLQLLTALANSLVSSKLDYCNSLYNGISQANLNKIQRIQNTLARVVTNSTSKFEQLHQYSKITLASNQTTHRLQTVSSFLHIKRFKFSNLLIFTIVFYFFSFSLSVYKII